MFCNSCGDKAVQGASFCASCGSELASEPDETNESAVTEEAPKLPGSTPVESSNSIAQSTREEVLTSENDQSQKKKGLTNDLLNFIAWGFNLEEAQTEAKTYGYMPSYKKSKNILVMIIAAIAGFSVLLAPAPETMASAVVYAILLIFVFMNHKWAMVAVGVLFSLDKLVVMAATGSLVGLIFAIVIGNQCARAYLVVRELQASNNENP